MSDDYGANLVFWDPESNKKRLKRRIRFFLRSTWAWIWRTARDTFREPAMVIAILCVIALTILESLYPRVYSLTALVVLCILLGIALNRRWEYHKHGYTIEQFAQYYDHTCGLWATDRPDLVQDPKKVLFKIEKIKQS